MGKQSRKDVENWMAGLMYASNIVKKEGAEGLKKEILRRGITKVPLCVDKREIEKNLSSCVRVRV